jgi:hypothetical protein
VTGNGAYGSEMNEIVLFESALRSAVPTRPDPLIGRELVPRLAQIARAATIEAETQASRRGTAVGAAGRARSRRALVARVAIVVGLIPLVLAGLAFAGVTVPGPARDAFDSLGITLPNQPSGHSKKATTTTAPSSQSGGNDVSSAAHTKAKGKGGNSAAAHQHALKQHEKARGKAIGHSRGKAIGLNDLTPPGQSGQTGPPSHSNAGGSARSDAARLAPKPHPHPFPPSNARGGGRSNHSG